MKAVKIASFVLILAVSAIAVKSFTPLFVIKQSASINISVNDDYDKLWFKADSLVNKGLTRSALDVVEVIYKKAKTENHTGNFVKAVMYKLKLQSYISEDDYVKEINDLTRETAEASFPSKPVLHSMMADIYWKYYQANRYRFLNRTETANFVPEDIRTWDLRKIIEQVIENYKLSLADADKLKKTSINVYSEILVPNTSANRELRPTLFDFLAHRAIDFFLNEEPGLTQPVNKFEINNPEYFSPYDKFSEYKISTEDYYSLQYYGTLLLQELIRFHKSDADPGILIENDLKRLKFMKQKCILPDKDTLYIQAIDQLINSFSTFPSSSEAIYEKALHYYQLGFQYKSKNNEDKRWMLKKAYEICDQAIKKFPDAFGSENCKYLQSKITEKSMSFTAEEVNVPDKPFRGLIYHRNINKVFIRIIKVNYQWNDNLTSKYYEYEKIIKQYLKQPVVAEFNVSLTNPSDYQQHTTEIKVPGLANGFYILLMGSSANFSIDHEAVCYTPLWVSNIAYLKKTLDGGNVQFLVTDRTSGTPLKGVGAQVYRQTYNYITREYEYLKGNFYYTDENGSFITTSEGDSYYNYFAELLYGKDQIKTDIFYQYRGYNYDRKKYFKSVYFTDRSIYRPGQTVYFKGILLETDGTTTEIKPAVNTTVTLYDVNYQKINELKLTTNEYGTYSGSFVLPTGVLNGQMHLGDNYGNIYFSVEEYKRPKFEVNFEPLKGSYRLGETINVKGIARSYSGANVDRAQVKYRIVRTASFPAWWYYWYRYYPDSPKMEIASGSCLTNDQGEFSIDFKAIPDYKVSKKSNPTFQYEIIADVTDQNGETQSDKSYVKVGYQALMLSVDMPENIEKKSAEKYQISSTNLSGTYEHSKGNIKIYRLKQPDKLFRGRLWEKPDYHTLNKDEYSTLFPNDLYEDENNSAFWQKESEVMNIGFDTKKDSLLTIKNLSNWASGQYVVDISAIDKFGEKVQSYTYFTLFDTDDKIIPVNQFSWFSEIKTKGEPGEEAQFVIGTREYNVSILMETEVKNKIVKKQWLKLNNEMRKITIPITEDFRGNFSVHFTFISKSRVYTYSSTVTVPYTNKELDITFESFRNKLLPGQTEEWKITVKGKKGEKVAAEMLATMYDASLDAFRQNNWYLNLYNYYYAQRRWETDAGFFNSNSQIFSYYWNDYTYLKYRTYEQLNWFGFYLGNYYNYRGAGDYGYMDMDDGGELYDYKNLAGTVVMEAAVATGKSAAKKESKNGEETEDLMVVDEEKTIDRNTKDQTKTTDIALIGGDKMDGKGESFESVKTRTNFNETAFFLPHLNTNENGEIVISFTVPESLTKWKFMGMAHTKDLKTGHIQKELITQKELMVVPNPPRFFREGDKIYFSSKVTNLSADSINGSATLILLNAENGEPLDILMNNKDQVKCFGCGKGKSVMVEWNISIPDNVTAITYKVIAKAGNHSDGEEMIIPVLTNRMLVTETLPLPIRGNQSKNFIMAKLIEAYKSSTLKHHKLTLEFTGNPSWYAVQALPYLIEYPYECTEQIFSRFYANSIATHIVNSNPGIKNVFESWTKITPDALLSNLEKNQDLKSVMLQETPWVLEAKNESQSKRNIGILLQSKRMKDEIEKALRKLERLQVPNGGWTWFPGMPDDRYITQHIITGFCHLDKLGVRDVKEQTKVWNMIRKGSRYLDNRIREDYEWILKYSPQSINENHIGGLQIQYLYARSYFIKDIAVEGKNKEAFSYFQGQAKKYWLQNNRYLQGMIALALNRLGDKTTPADILKSLKENAIFSEEMGMYWKDMSGGYYWYQAPVETQALLIECFDEVGKDQKTVEELKVWLLKQKQTQNWKSTKATAEACYALLLRGTDWLAKDPDINIMLGNESVDPKKSPDIVQQAGTGYFRKSWLAEAINPEMGKIKVTKSDEGVAWGAIYWQYFEQLDKITPAETPLKINKKLFVEKNSAHGPIIEPVDENSALMVGDKIKVRIELRVDRDMEYVHMKDMRASGFEPINVISKYKYQGGLGYYESTGDVATNFFISSLPKGTYVFEYPLRIAQKGNFSNGITSIQCMYAPEFSSHSEGIRVKVGG